MKATILLHIYTQTDNMHELLNMRGILGKRKGSCSKVASKISYTSITIKKLKGKQVEIKQNVYYEMNVFQEQVRLDQEVSQDRIIPD